MKFCKKCNSIMKPVDNNILQCVSCDYQEDGELISKESIPGKTEIKKDVIEDRGNEFANYEHKCKKCGFDKAQIVEREPYITDEDTLLFLKCGKCGFMENLSRKIM
ncbi:hypothetical protein GF386_06595 [Candidatus Pacearchaeota archaeon]|nr:hypothetical protein [Candidatus Pacearchaeota archaeon]MBD3283763.1 hypothetical protein [Candidatus Pacearchaeota archaeon]